MANVCYIFMGPSGSGKTTLSKNIFPENQKVISHTTRSPRKGEVNKMDYFFVSKQTFKEMLTADLFAEFDEYDNEYYGVTKLELAAKLAKNNCYDVLTLNGFLKLEETFGDKKMIPVLLVIKKETAVKRLENRGELPEVIRKRLALLNQENQAFELLKDRKSLITINADQTIEEMTAQFKQATSI